MKVSVVICTFSFHRYNDILNCVNSILKQTYQNFELVVSVDNNVDLVNELKKALPPQVIIVMNNKSKGLSNNRNTGIAASSGDIIAFIDDDAYADKFWLEMLVDNFKDLDILAVGGKIVPLWEGGEPKWFPDELNWIVGCTYSGHPKNKCQIKKIIGCNMAFKKSVFKQVGLFTNEIGRVGSNQLAGEESEICLRIYDQIMGAKIIYEPKAIVYHKVPKERQSFNYIKKRSYYGGVSMGIIRKMYNMDNKTDILATENKYLKYILISFLNYLVGMIRKDSLINFIKAYLIMVAVMYTGFGFAKSFFMKVETKSTRRFDVL